MKIEFLIDIVARDLPTAAAICLDGAPNSLHCDFGTTFVSDGERRCSLVRSWRRAPDLVVTPWYNSRRTLEILARARVGGARLIHFPSEQFFSRAFDAEKLNSSCAENYRRDVEAIFVWGEYYARRLVEDVGYPRERIYEVGSPRLEFVRQSRVPKEQSDQTRRVLFISDFTLADFTTKRQRTAFERAYGVPVSESDVRQLGSERDRMVDTARRLVELPGFEVRLRPHPGENTSLYREACDHSAVEYGDPAGEFTEDLLWADAVIGYTSTAIFEVIAAGRPFFALRHAVPPSIVQREAVEPLYRTFSADDLIRALQQPDFLASTYRAVARESRYCVGNVDGAYDSISVFGSALQAVALQPPIRRSRLVDRVRTGIGTVRALAKHLGFRLFASKLWSRCGAWQPAAVRRRLLKGHALTDEAIETCRRSPRIGATIERPGRAESAIHWTLGSWCWRPSSKGAPASIGSQDDAQ